MCLYLEPAQTSAHATDGHGIEATLLSGDHVYVHTHETTADPTDDSAPDRDSAEPHAHHCGSAHAAYLASSGGIYAGEQAVLDARFAIEAPADISRRGSSLERPPRESFKA